MNYQPPAIRYHGDVNELLRHLVAIKTPETNSSDRRMALLTEYIDSHGGHIGGIEQACRALKLDISGAYAARLFKRSVGFGIREYSKRKRLSTAAFLLGTTDIPIKAIAAEFGYRSASDFTRRFKKQFNVSPTQFRRNSSRRSEPSKASLHKSEPTPAAHANARRRTA